MAVNEIEVRIKDRSKTAAIAEVASLCGRYKLKMAGDWTTGADGFVALHRIRPPHGVVPRTYDGAIPFPPSPTEESEVYLIAPIASGVADVSLKNDLLVADLNAYYGPDDIAEVRATFYEKDDDDNLSMAGSGMLQVKVTQAYGELTPSGGFSIFKGPKGDTGVQGEDGDSAYEVAVRNGFQGSEEEWIASLIGPAGSVQYVYNPTTKKYHQLIAKTNMLGQVVLSLAKTGIDTPPAVGEFTTRAEAAALRAETAEAAVPAAKTEALTAINEAKTLAIGDSSTAGSIVKAQTDAVAAIGTTKETALGEIDTAKTNAIGTAETDGSIAKAQADALAAIGEAVEDAIGDGTSDGAIQTAQASAIGAIEGARDDAIGDAETEGTIKGEGAAAINSVQEEGATQVAAVQAVVDTAIANGVSVAEVEIALNAFTTSTTKTFQNVVQTGTVALDYQAMGFDGWTAVGVAGFSTTYVNNNEVAVDTGTRVSQLSVGSDSVSYTVRNVEAFARTVTLHVFVLMVKNAVETASTSGAGE